MTVPAPDMARRATLPQSLELQMVLGHGVETLYRLQHGSIDQTSAEILRALAARFERAAEDLSGRPRTLAQSAATGGMVTAAQQALPGAPVRQQLLDLASELASVAHTAAEERPNVADLIDSLSRLHEVLAAGRSLPSDEVRGLRRLE
jgi:ABC-type transporter Mla subunit MlaD